jgi:glycosyltransferase involved in cell wall biosynthesis
VASIRILHVIPAVAARYGGPSSAVVSMCRALMSHGVETLIASTDADGTTRLDVPTGEVTSWQGVPAVFFTKAWSESFKYSPTLSAWLGNHVAEFDLVHIHGVFSHACIAAASACRRASVPYVVRPLGTLASWSLGQKPLRKRALLSLAAGKMLRAAAGIHYTSAEEQRSVEAALGLSDGFVVPLGIDSDLLDVPMIPPADRQRNPYVLALSRMHPKKNLESLIRAFLQMRASHRGWTLVIAGTGDAVYVDALRQLVADLGGADCVRFPGWVEGSRKRDLVAAASLFVLCSKHENFGVAVLEALAASVPVIVSAQVDLSSDVDRAGAGWVTDGSDAALATTLTRALSDAEARESRGAAARELARRFTWPLVASRLCQQYDTIVTARPVRVSGLTVVPR